MITPYDYDDDDLLPDEDSDETSEWDDEGDYEPDIVLCPRCESFEMLSSDQTCWRCQQEIWLHENG